MPVVEFSDQRLPEKIAVFLSVRLVAIDTGAVPAAEDGASRDPRRLVLMALHAGRCLRGELVAPMAVRAAAAQLRASVLDSKGLVAIRALCGRLFNRLVRVVTIGARDLFVHRKARVCWRVERAVTAHAIPGAVRVAVEGVGDRIGRVRVVGEPRLVYCQELPIHREIILGKLAG